MSSDLLRFDEPSWLNPPPLVVEQAPPWLDEPQLPLDEPVQAEAIEEYVHQESCESEAVKCDQSYWLWASVQSPPSPNHNGSVEQSAKNRQMPITADFQTSQRSISHDDIVHIHSFFQKIRQEEFERINKKRKMHTAQSGDSSFRNDNNQLDMPMAAQPLSMGHGEQKWLVPLQTRPPWGPGRAW